MNPGVGLSDADHEAIQAMVEYGPPGAPAKGGRKRWEGICTACEAELRDDGTCSFCDREFDSSPADFENGDEAAREFLYRVGVEPDE